MSSASQGRCPECNAEVFPGDRQCWMCDHRIAAPDVPRRGVVRPIFIDEDDDEEAPGPSEQIHGDFTLGSVFLLMTLICVLLGLTAAAPGLGATLIVASTPAWIRTAVLSRRKKAVGKRLSTSEKISAFLGSLGVVIATGVAVGIAFLATCFATCFGLAGVGAAKGYGENLLFPSVFVGVLFGLPVLVFMVRRFWPIRK